MSVSRAIRPSAETPAVPPGTGLLDVVSAARRSVVRRVYASSPLRLLTPRNHGRAAWIYSGSYGGGLVGGDALRLTVRVGEGASAFLSTQASTKVYHSDLTTSLELSAEVGARASCVIWPDPVVCFAGSSYQQQQRIDVAASGSVVLVDWMTSGRRASGERWRFRQYVNRSTIRYDGKLVLFDSTCLNDDDGDLAARMGRFDVLGSATIVGPQFGGAVDRILTSTAKQSIERRAAVLVATAPLADVGCITRIAGASVEQIAHVLREYLSFVPSLLGDDPWTRKW